MKNNEYKLKLYYLNYKEKLKKKYKENPYPNFMTNFNILNRSVNNYIKRNHQVYKNFRDDISFIVYKKIQNDVKPFIRILNKTYEQFTDK